MTQQQGFVESSFDTLKSIHHVDDIPPLWIAIGAVFFALIAFVSTAYKQAKAHRPWPQWPVVDLEEERGLSPKDSWLYHGKELVNKGLRLYPNGFQVMQASGPRIILPNRFADDLRKIPDWSFLKWVEKEFHVEYPGMDAFKAHGGGNDTIVEVARVKITQSLNHITSDLSEEAANDIEKMYGSSKEWKSTAVKDDIMDLVARLSARVFLGKDLSRNEDWIHISKSYAIDCFQATKDMRTWNDLILPIAHWFIPRCRRVRQHLAKARQIINPEVERRTAMHNKAIAAGEKPAKLFDAVSWTLEAAHGKPVDVAVSQLTLATVAINTTSELTAFCLLELVQHPEFFQPLRDEIVEVLSTEGWAKNSLYKMKLLDSFIKETQRLHPVQWSSMRRWTGREQTLSDGTVIPKGAAISVTQEWMEDAKHYPEPAKFDPYRFYKLRQQPGHENSWQLSTVSAEHMGFGYGDHACPGRFFAANEIKIALAHLLLKYEWRLPDGQTHPPEEYIFETQHAVSPDAVLMYRRRQEEIQLDGPPKEE